MHQKFTKKKWPKIEHFSNTFDNIYLTKTLRSFKIGYRSGPALLLTVDSGNKLLPSVFEAFSSQQVDNFKMPEMASFWSFHEFSGSVEAICPPKGGYPSTDTPQLDFECRFLVATATRVEIQSQKGFSTVYHRQSMYEEDKNSGE